MNLLQKWFQLRLINNENEVKIFHCGNTKSNQKKVEPFNIKGIRQYNIWNNEINKERRKFLMSSINELKKMSEKERALDVVYDKT